MRYGGALFSYLNPKIPIGNVAAPLGYLSPGTNLLHCAGLESPPVSHFAKLGVTITLLYRLSREGLR